MKKMKYFGIIKRPIITEKSTALSRGDEKGYLFEVAMDAEKDDIKAAVESLFDVKVKEVNTVIVRGKVKQVKRVTGKRNNRKKAYVTLQKGYSINFIEGV
ncbi:MAG TPA: 50S ribosomal protein L23 [bacterium]|nr:50S ribosomal protein L23 [bacterium]